MDKSKGEKHMLSLKKALLKRRAIKLKKKGLRLPLVNWTKRSFIHHEETIRRPSTMLLVSVLAACGNSISKDQAVSAAKKIQAFHNADTFAYKTDKVTFTASIGDNGNLIETDIRVIKDTYVYNSTRISAATSEKTSAPSLASEEYLYTKEDKYYHVQSLMGTVVANEEITKDAFTNLYNGTTGVPGLGVTTLLAITSAAENAYSNIDSFIAANETSSSSKADSSVTTSDVTSALPVISMSSEEGMKEDFSYSSLGDGNLTITDNVSVSNASDHTSGQTSIVFNNYYPESISGFSKGTVVQSSSEVAANGTVDMRWKWGQCTEVYPVITASSVSK